MKNISVYEIEVDPRSKPNDIMGGDMCTIKRFATEKAALKYAIKESFGTITSTGKPLHEIWVEKYDSDGDIEEQWAYKNGVQTYHIRPN